MDPAAAMRRSRGVTVASWAAMRLVGLALALVACGATPPPPPPPPVIAAPPPPPAPPPDAAVDAGPTPVALALARLAELSDAMCRCADGACATELAEQARATGQPLGVTGDGAAPTEAEQQQARELSERLVRCMADAMTRPAPGLPR